MDNETNACGTFIESQPDIGTPHALERTESQAARAAGHGRGGTAVRRGSHALIRSAPCDRAADPHWPWERWYRWVQRLFCAPGPELPNVVGRYCIGRVACHFLGRP